MALGAWLLVAAADSPASGYQNDFSKAEVGKMPDEMLVLDGDFAVKEEGTNRWVELPGSPLETFGVIFGPPTPSNALVRAKIFGTQQGRRFPAFGVGLNGQNGYRLQIAPSKKAMELWKSGQVVTNVPFTWKGGTWYVLQLETTRRTGFVEVTARAWTEGEKEPGSPLIQWKDSESVPEGRASIWGTPYSGTPIRFDDLELRTRK